MQAIASENKPQKYCCDFGQIKKHLQFGSARSATGPEEEHDAPDVEEAGHEDPLPPAQLDGGDGGLLGRLLPSCRWHHRDL